MALQFQIWCTFYINQLIGLNLSFLFHFEQKPFTNKCKLKAKKTETYTILFDRKKVFPYINYLEITELEIKCILHSEKNALYFRVSALNPVIFPDWRV